MALIMNASSKEQQVKVHGAWFSFKSKQVKDMHEDKAYFLSTKYAEAGFVTLPQELEDLEFRASEEGKKLMREAEERGIANRVAHLEFLKHNELVSLKRDISMKNLNYDSRLEMTPHMLEQMEELAAYKLSKQDDAQKRVDRIKEIEKILEE